VNVNVTLRDIFSRPVSGAAVSATDPKGGVFSLSEVSAGEYFAVYFVAVDDPAGVWVVNVSAVRGGERAWGWVSVAVNPSNFRVDVLSPGSGSVWNRGEAVVVAVNVTYLNGSAVLGASVFAADPSGVLSIALGEVGGGVYSGSYTILSTDGPGLWLIMVNATKDGAFDLGSADVRISSTYGVTVVSPAAGSVNRGETVVIAVSVLNVHGAAVSGATVEATDPGGGLISLVETATLGTYSSEYTVQADDPMGGWVLSVNASMNGNLGVASVLMVVNATYTVSIVSPPVGVSFTAGDGVTVSVSVLNVHGAAVSGATVSAVSPSGGFFALAETTVAGVYNGSYTVQAGDPVGVWVLNVSASKGGNLGAGSVSLTVSARYTLAVLVRDSSTGGAVEGANVTVDGRWGLTNGTGWAVFSGLSPGNYSVTISKGGYEPASGAVSVAVSNTAASFTTCELALSSVAEPLDVVLIVVVVVVVVAAAAAAAAVLLMRRRKPPLPSAST
jgi:hypothetical protein